MELIDQVRDLVHKVVKSYLQEKLLEKKAITVLLDSPSSQSYTVRETVILLLDSYNVTLLLSKNWLPDFHQYPHYLLEEMTSLKLTTIIEKTTVLVVPTASYRLLTKLALTIDDETTAWLAIQYQLKGKPIVIANNQIELSAEQQILLPHTVQARIKTYIRQIQADQVKWVPLSKLFKSVDEQIKMFEEKKSLILAKHVEQAYREGLTELNVPTKSQLTPAAKDIARELKININNESAKGG